MMEQVNVDFAFVEKQKENCYEYNIIKQADYIIDLGPGGGNKGGEIVATGTPEDIVLNPKSLTGIYLKKVLERK